MESACQEIIRLAEKVMDGGQITPEEAGRLIRTKDEDTMLLLAMADKIRQKFGGSSVDFCAIINARRLQILRPVRLVQDRRQGIPPAAGRTDYRSGKESKSGRRRPVLHCYQRP